MDKAALKTALIKSGLLGAVNDRDGTAFEARIEGGVLVAGKTGTAEVSKKKLNPKEDRTQFQRIAIFQLALALDLIFVDKSVLCYRYLKNTRDMTM